MNRKIEKKNFEWKLYAFILIVCCGIFLGALQGKTAPSAESTLDIYAKSVEGEYGDKGFVSYLGDVEARQGDFSVRCQRLTLYFKEQSKAKPKAKSTEKESPDIDKLIAKDRVVVTRHSDGLTANCEEAVYFQDEEKIVATGNPVLIKQGRNWTECAKLILFVKTNRFNLEGNLERPVKSYYVKPSN